MPDPARNKSIYQLFRADYLVGPITFMLWAEPVDIQVNGIRENVPEADEEIATLQHEWPGGFGM